MKVLRNYANEVLAVLKKPMLREEIVEASGLERKIVVSSLLYLESRNIVTEHDDRWSLTSG